MTTDDDPLEALLDEWESARARGQPRSPEEIWADHPSLHDYPSMLESFRGRVARLLQADALGLGGNPSPGRGPSGSVPRPEIPSPGVSVSRFKDLSYIAQGGLGVVYSAIDDIFGRKVALKFLRPDRSDFPEIRDRFLKEARLTAGLDHPGIVPVYGQGVASDGRPYYAMGLVDGGTLQDQIDGHYFRYPSGANSTEQSLGFRRLLGQVVSVCNTVAYAHAENVLHRDLKPINVKVGRFDRVIVLDWGLARATTSDRLVAEDFVENAPLAPDATTPGQGLGTWGFASPEQTEGRHDEVGPRSDVYSLGAVLYCVLTGNPPFSAESREELKRKVLAGEFLPPRGRDATLDPALEAVCLKAMALKPEHRHASAQELGEDLRRWLADEPVSAYREPGHRRIARWRRRNRLLSGVLTGVSVVALAGLIGGGIWLKETWRRELLGRQVEGLLIVAEGKIVAGDFGSARVDLGGASALIDRESGYESARHRIKTAVDRAEARGRVSTFLEWADQAEQEILGSYWALLPHEDTENRRRITHPGERSADLPGGVDLARAALGAIGVSGGRDPFGGLTDNGIGKLEVTHVRIRAGELTFLLGIAVERLGQGETATVQVERREGALRLLDEAEALGFRGRVLDHFRAEIVGRGGDPERAKALRDRAESGPPLGFFDHHFAAADLGREKRWEEAIAAYQLASASRPNEYWTLFRMGKALENDRQLGRAESAYRACLAITPNDPTIQNSLGTLLLSQKRWEAAAIELEAVVRKHPEYLMAHTNLMMAHAERADVKRTEEVFLGLRDLTKDPRRISEAWNHLGLAYERAKNDREALRCYTRAIDADPRSSGALRNRATVWIGQEKFKEAEADLNAAIALDPLDGELHYVKGNLYGFSDRPKEAEEEYTEALRLDPKLIFAHNNRGVVRGQLGRLEEAIEDHRAVLEAAPNHPDARVSIANCYARMSQRDGDPVRLRLAMNVVAEALERDPGNVDALSLRGKLHGDLGKFVDGIGPDVDLAQSEADLTEVIRLAPDDPDGYRSRGKTRHNSQNWKGAIEDWRHYLRLVPNARDAADIANDLSTAYLELGDVDKAIEELNKAKRGGARPSYFANLGNVYLKGGELDRAVSEFDKAIAADPGHTRAWALRGQARLRQGRFAEAVSDLDRALELEPGFYETLALNGTARLARGDAIGARRVLEEIVKDRPDHARGRYAMGRLKLVEGDNANAILELSRAMGDPILRTFALGPRAEAWLSLGGGALAAATADADSLCLALPGDGLAHLDASRVHARAAALSTDAQSPRWKGRAVTLLDRALTLQPDLRPRALADDVLRPLIEPPRPSAPAGQP